MRRRIVTVLGILLSLMILLGMGIHYFFFDLQRIKGQEFLEEALSPSGEYKAIAYRNNKGATTSYSILVTVEERKTKRTKNIYWQYRQEEIEMEWINDKEILLNQMILDVTKEEYDWRKQE